MMINRQWSVDRLFNPIPPGRFNLEYEVGHGTHKRWFGICTKIVIVPTYLGVQLTGLQKISAHWIRWEP